MEDKPDKKNGIMKRITRLCRTEKCGFENICDRKTDNIFDVIDRLQRTKRQVYGVYDKETRSCNEMSSCFE